MTGSTLVAVGHHQPERILDNAELSRIVETNDEWITSRVGIKTRHIAAPEDTVDGLALGAARNACERFGIDPKTIDMVIVASCTAVDRSPNVAARVAANLGIAAPAVIDINVACSGFLHALAIADHSIRAGSTQRALVIGVEILSRFVDWTDRSTCVLLGDGAGAFIVDASETENVGPVLWGSDPVLADAVRIEAAKGVFEQEGQSVFRWTTTRLPALARETVERAGVDVSDLGAVVLHQANLRIIEPLGKKIGAENAVLARDVIESGNTSAASVPTAVSKMVAAGTIPAGKPVLLFGFGGGLAYAGQVLRSVPVEPETT